MNTVTEADDKKVSLFSPYIHWTKNGISINKPNMISSMPIDKKNGFVIIHF